MDRKLFVWTRFCRDIRTVTIRRDVLGDIMTELLGWISATLLAVCGIFQMVETIDLGSVQGLSSWFIVTWFLGEIFGLYYVCKKKQYPLIVNYLLNLLATSVLLWYLLS